MQQFAEAGHAVMLFGLFAVLESPAVFDVVVHGLKDLNRLCTSR